MTLSVREEGAPGLNVKATGPVKDRQTVSPEGEPIAQRIAGVIVHAAGLRLRAREREIRRFGSPRMLVSKLVSEQWLSVWI